MLAFILLGSIAQASLAPVNQYEVNMDLSINGTHLSSPHLVVKDGSLATITQTTHADETFIDVLATNDPAEKGIRVKLVFGTVDKDGRWTMSRPEVLVQEGMPARLTVHKKNGDTEIVSLTVSKKRKL